MSILNDPIVRMEDHADRLWEQGDKERAIKLYKWVDFYIWRGKSILGILLPKFLSRKYWEKYVMNKKLYGEE